MKHNILKIGIITSLFLCGCAEKKTLFVYNWSDYVDMDLVARFEAENDCEVVIDSFDDNETMLAKMMSGATGYDVIFPSSYIIPTLVKNGLIERIDANQLPNVVANLDWKYKDVFHDDTMVYSVPYAFSITGIAYRNDVYATNSSELSWDLLKNPAFKNRVSILNDIREMLGIGLIKYGYSINTTSKKEIDRALKYSMELKKLARKMDNVQYRTGLVNGEFYIAIGYSSDILQVKDENPDAPITFFIPNEGSTCCWDEMAIPVGANRELAYKFIDFLYNPENAAQNMKYVCSTVPNKGMWQLLSDEERNNELLNISTETLKKVELVKDVGEAMRFYNMAWDVFTTNN